MEVFISQVTRIALEKALNKLSEILLAWMDQKGLRFEDSREIFDHTVKGSRERHQWEGGK